MSLRGIALNAKHAITHGLGEVINQVVSRGVFVSNEKIKGTVSRKSII